MYSGCRKKFELADRIAYGIKKKKDYMEDSIVGPVSVVNLFLKYFEAYRANTLRVCVEK